jgi:hypothetical protein
VTRSWIYFGTPAAGGVLLGVFILFTIQKSDRMFTHTLVAGLNDFGSRP